MYLCSLSTVPECRAAFVKTAIVLFALSCLSGCQGKEAVETTPRNVATRTMDPTYNPSSSTIVGSLNRATAISDARTALAKSPGDIKSRIKLAILLDSSGDGSAAEDVLREGLQKGIKDAEFYHTVGLFYMKHQVKAPAVEAFFAETQLAPKSAVAHCKLAEALGYIGKSEEAQIEYDRAIKLDPKMPEPYLGMAYLNNSPDKYKVAIRYLEEYIAISDKKGPGYGLLSRVYLNMHQYDKAVVAGESATKSMPTDGNLWYLLGQAYFYNPNKVNLVGAEEAFNNTLKFGPTAHAHFELANVLLRLNKIDRAADEYREAVRMDPTNGKAHYQLGQTLLRLGKREEATAVLAKSKGLIKMNQDESLLLDKLTVSPHNAKLEFELASLYSKLGMYDRARNWFRSTLEDNPNYPDAARMLAETEKLVNSSVRSEKSQ